MQLIKLFFILLMFGISGCAVSHNNSESAGNPIQAQGFALDEIEAPNPAISDPLESYNRAMHGFNDFVLLDVIKPVHQGYGTAMPSTARSGLANLSDHLLTPVRLINSILQLDFGGASVELAHFIANTVTSLGLADVASREEANFYYNPDAYDFGVTLAVWGVGEGPVVNLPFFGPKTLRDCVGFAGDIAMDPLTYVTPLPVTFANGGLTFNDIDTIYTPYEYIATRAEDPYIATRDAIVLRRRALIENHINNLR